MNGRSRIGSPTHLYGWREVPISPPGSGSQSWLLCPLISLGLLDAEHARSVPAYSTGSRFPVPDQQRTYWMAHAMDIIHAFSQNFQSLNPQCAVAQGLQSFWARGDHLPGSSQEECCTPHVTSVLHAWICAQCNSFHSPDLLPSSQGAHVPDPSPSASQVQSGDVPQPGAANIPLPQTVRLPEISMEVPPSPFSSFSSRAGPM